MKAIEDLEIGVLNFIVITAKIIELQYSPFVPIQDDDCNWKDGHEDHADKQGYA